MQFKNIWHRFLRINSINVVWVELNDTGIWHSHIALYKLSSGKLELISQAKEIEGQNELLDRIDSKKPNTLIISGKGILCKQLQEGSSDDVNQMLAQVLPNAQAEEFYLQENKGSLNIARKDLVNDILNTLNENSLDVIELSLGGSVVNTDEEIKPDNILREYAQKFLIQNKGQGASRFQRISGQWNDYRYGLMFKRLGMAFLVFCLIILLANFLAFDHYNKQHARLITNAGMLNTNKQKIVNLQQELVQKQEVLDRSGLKDATRISYFLDRMVASMPDQLTLNGMNVNPRESGLRNSDMHFNKGIIILSGNVSQGKHLNNWMDKLRAFEWIDQVKISDYNHKSQNKRADFELRIILKSDV